MRKQGAMSQSGPRRWPGDIASRSSDIARGGVEHAETELPGPAVAEEANMALGVGSSIDHRYRLTASVELDDRCETFHAEVAGGAGSVLVRVFLAEVEDDSAIRS